MGHKTTSLDDLIKNPIFIAKRLENIISTIPQEERDEILKSFELYNKLMDATPGNESINVVLRAAQMYLGSAIREFPSLTHKLIQDTIEQVEEQISMFTLNIDKK